MRCPYCGSKDIKVTHTDRETKRRFRFCNTCLRSFRTREKIDKESVIRTKLKCILDSTQTEK